MVKMYYDKPSATVDAHPSQVENMVQKGWTLEPKKTQKNETKTDLKTEPKGGK